MILTDSTGSRSLARSTGSPLAVLFARSYPDWAEVCEAAYGLARSVDNGGAGEVTPVEPAGDGTWHVFIHHPGEESLYVVIVA